VPEGGIVRPKDRVRLRRAGIVLASVQGRPVSVIAQMFAAGEGYVREVIHAFNDTGVRRFGPKMERRPAP
jgi:transposase